MCHGFTAILLSSFTKLNNHRFKDLFNQLVNNKEHRRDGNLVYVPTAKYYNNKISTKSYGEQRRRARYEARDKCRLLNNCFECKGTYILELDNPALNRQQIVDIISKASVLYVDGGNTFYLQKYIIQCQFWDIVTPYLQSNNCIYIGASAGGIVLGRSIETAYWKGWDDPSCAGEDFMWIRDGTLRGANLIPDTSFFMHYDCNKHDDLLSKHRPTLDHNVELISDDIALVYTALPVLTTTTTTTAISVDDGHDQSSGQLDKIIFSANFL